MPFTPFHFGPGLLVKGSVPERFSWAAFAITQVVIDCETLYYLVNNKYPLHRTLHTFVGATIVGAATSAVLIFLKRRTLKDLSPAFKSEASEPAIWTGGLIGGASHPFFDGLMHRDIRPFWPFTDRNLLSGLVGVGALHLSCIAAGLLGALLLAQRSCQRHKRTD